jgi:ribosome-associated heat shock protein Hsp15
LVLRVTYAFADSFFHPEQLRGFYGELTWPCAFFVVAGVNLPVSESVGRLDKWLWAIRIFKTRPLATEACRAGEIEVNALPAKPSRDVRPGETVTFSQGVVRRTLRVVAVPPARVGAKLVPKFCTDLTPLAEWEKGREERRQHVQAREAGSGRPTKRERRVLDRFFE